MRTLSPFRLVALAIGPVLAFAGADVAAQDSGRAASAAKVRISKKDCRRLVRHQASADVAYKPGVDVRGRPVAPADATGAFTIPLPDVFEFTVTKDLKPYLQDSDDVLAAEKAAAIAAEQTLEATDAAVSSAALSLAGAQTISDTAQAALEAAQAAAAAAPKNDDLAAAVTTAQATADTAAAGLAATQSAYDATQAAAEANNASTALASAEAAQSAAEDIGYVQDATAQTASSTATTAASEAAAADTTALAATDTVVAAANEAAKSPNMELAIGTVRYNIKTGAMTFNGQPLTDPAEAALAEQCRAMMGGK